MLLSYPSSSLQWEWRSWGAFPMWVISIHLAREEGCDQKHLLLPQSFKLNFSSTLRCTSLPGSYKFLSIFFLYIIASRKQNKNPNVLLQSLDCSDVKRSFFTSFELGIQLCGWVVGLGSKKRSSCNPGLGLPGQV